MDDGCYNLSKMFDYFLHDCMVKRNMHMTAEIFREEAGVPDIPAAIDSPEGFLSEWWSVFFDTCMAREMKGQLPWLDDQQQQLPLIPFQMFQKKSSQMPRTSGYLNLQQMQMERDSNLAPLPGYLASNMAGEQMINNTVRGVEYNIQNDIGNLFASEGYDSCQWKTYLLLALATPLHADSFLTGAQQATLSGSVFSPHGRPWAQVKSTVRKQYPSVQLTASTVLTTSFV